MRGGGVKRALAGNMSGLNKRARRWIIGVSVTLSVAALLVLAVWGWIRFLYLTSCDPDYTLRLPEVKSLEKEIRKMPDVIDAYNVYSEHHGMEFIVKCGDITKEDAIDIFQRYREMMAQDGFQDKFLTTTGKGDSAYYLSHNECPLQVRVYVLCDSYPRMPREVNAYRFSADFFKDGDMSGKNEGEESIYDGYSTWRGALNQEEFSMEEILAAD